MTRRSERPSELWLVFALAFAAAAVILAFCAKVPGQQIDLPADQRARFANRDGSCVQCAIGMLGVWQNVPAAELLLWDSEFGPAVRGGAVPGRVREYCRSRGIDVHVVVGDVVAWVEWACRTRRGAAVAWVGRGGVRKNHMVTVVGMSDDRRRFAICDSNRPATIRWMDRPAFEKSVGGWAVILDAPPGPGTARVVAWWE